MSRFYSINRELDFVRLESLRRITGQPPHEWDLYILKELIDNALDADDELWFEDRFLFPRIAVRLEYLDVPERRSRQLFVQVANRAEFPVDQLKRVFDTRHYSSRKFIKGTNRGALGNALKTLLGIPHALRGCVASDWNPELKALSIQCGSKEYLPRYVVDGTEQTVRLKVRVRDVKPRPGTVLGIGLDHFVQEIPRTREQIEKLASEYHLCNPHAQFLWHLEIGGEEWKWEHAPRSGWIAKFGGPPFAQWYSPKAFQDLLGVMYREECEEGGASYLTVERVCRVFAGFSPTKGAAYRPRSTVEDVARSLNTFQLSKSDIEGPLGLRLFHLLSQSSPQFEVTDLGALGSEHLRAAFGQLLELDGDVVYGKRTTIDDPENPFVLEGVLARTRSGTRQVWIAVNFSPSYTDPFLRRRLYLRTKPGEPVFGLGGFLDAYGLQNQTPVVLFVHLVSPILEHEEFSKTEFNHLPFRKPLEELLDGLVEEFAARQEQRDRDLEQRMHRVIEDLVAELGPGEKILFAQLLQQVQRRLWQDSDLRDWLEQPGGLERLRARLSDYQSQSPRLSQRLIQAESPALSLPLHPDLHFDLPVDLVSRAVLDRHYINKILCAPREIELIALANRWLCHMDMALLRAGSLAANSLPPVLARLAAAATGLPILVLYGGTGTGPDVAEIRRAVENHGLTPGVVVDISAGEGQLQEFPHALERWLAERLRQIGIPLKQISTEGDIRRDVRKRFEHLLLSQIWEGLADELQIARFLARLDDDIGIASRMRSQALDDQVRQRLLSSSCSDSYDRVIESVAAEFFEELMREQGPRISRKLWEHLSRLRNEGPP